MGKYTVEDYLNEMDLTETEEEENEEVEEGLDQELTEGLQVLEENLILLLTEAKKKGMLGKTWKSFTKKAKGVGATVAGKAEATKKAVTKKAGEAKKFVAKKAAEVKKHPVKAGLAGAGLAAALGGGALAYRKFFGKAAKACKDLKGAEKAACMKKFRAGATEAAIMTLQDSVSHCDDSKNPEKCYARVNEAIEQLRANLDVLREG